jgi:hypothetical protein
MSSLMHPWGGWVLLAEIVVDRLATNSNLTGNVRHSFALRVKFVNAVIASPPSFQPLLTDGLLVMLPVLGSLLLIALCHRIFGRIQHRGFPRLLSSRGIRGSLPSLWFLLQQWQDRIAQVLHQVKAICHLHGLGRTQPGGIGKGRKAIPSHHLN